MKQRIIISILIFFLANGCVSLKKYDELKNSHADLEAQIVQNHHEIESLEAENLHLKQKAEGANGEIAQLKKGAEIFYNRGIESFRQENYDDALEAFEKVLDKFPADPLASTAAAKISEIKSLSAGNYQATLKGIEGIRDIKSRLDFLDKESSEKYFIPSDLEKIFMKKESIAEELRAQEEMNKHIIIEDDPTQSVRRYRTTRSTVQYIGYEKTFYIELYINQTYSGKKDLRLKTRYVGNSWISYDSIILRGEGIQIEVICKYPEKLSNMSDDRIYEWSDNDIDDDKVIRLVRNGHIAVRFNGGYKFTFPLDDEKLLGFKEIVRKYHSLK